MKINPFIDRPVFAAVISIVFVLAGLVAMRVLPVEQYPQIVPPQVVVQATYPGASAETVAQTVAAPLEQQINGVENMLYMQATNSSAGTMRLTVTFKIGTNPDQATINVNNRVQRAVSTLPAEVTRQGLIVNKQSSVVLAVPFALFGALVAIWLRGLNNDVYFQIGLVTLIGLASKNAILIVEFAVLKRREGLSAIEAATEAAKLRFRPIIMTSLAFILGCVPLAISSGAGAASRHSIGTGVIGGMLAATFVAVFFIPMFYRLISANEPKRQVEAAGIPIRS
jgi:multidrug efflux pump subunit AcrB